MENVERVGNILKKTREQRGLSLEQIADKTRISQKFLRQIEESQFEDFPADIYLYGFIHNYGEQLRLDPIRLVEQFKHEQAANRYHTRHSPTLGLLDQQDQERRAEEEQRSPVRRQKEEESLAVSLAPPPPFWLRRVTWIYAAGALAGLLLVLLVLRLLEAPGTTIISTENQATVAQEYKMMKDRDSFDLRVNDVIKIFIDDSANIFQLVSIAGNSATFTLNNQKQTVLEKQSAYVDLNGDNVNDLEVKLSIISGDLAIFGLSIFNYQESKIDYQGIWDNQDHIVVTEEDYVLFKRQDKFPISVYLKASAQSSFLQYNIDGKRQDSRKLSPGEETVIKADDHLELQIGNYRTVALVVNKHPLTLQSKSGSFQATKIIKWIPDPDNETKFDLIIKDSYN